MRCFLVDAAPDPRIYPACTMTDQIQPATRTRLDLRPSTTGTFEAPDGLKLFEQAWLPAQRRRSTIVLVHGYAEHSGRYAQVAASLSAQGHAVYTYDQRGHGRSEGRRGYVDRFDHYLDDLGVFLQRVRRSGPGTPLFLMGHSMGGTVCTRFCLERAPGLSGLILSSPMLRPAMDIPPLLRWLSPVVATFFPTLPTLYLNRDDLSRDPAVVAAAKSDPLNYHQRIPARAGHEMIRAGQRIRAGLESLSIPFLVFHGTHDRIADPRSSIELYTRAAAEDKTLSLYEGLRHETLNEPEKHQIMDELIAWLEEHL